MFLLTLIFFAGITITSSRNLCDDCTDDDPFGAWTPWSNCAAKTNNECYKVQTRMRSRSIFFCDHCREQKEERRCQQCEQQCSNGVCSCQNGFALDNDQLRCTRLKCMAQSRKTCPSTSYKDHIGNACIYFKKVCTRGDFYESKCTFSCPQGFGLAVISPMPDRNYFAEFINESDFKSVKKEASCILNIGNQLSWNVDPSNYFCRRLNDAPRNLKISNSNINENLPINTIVGSISSFDENGDVVYTMESSEGSTFFNLLGDKLRTSKVLSWNHLTKSSFEVKIKAIDNTSPSFFTTKNFDIVINNVDDSPKNIELSNANFNDLNKVGHVIGFLTAEDIDQKPSIRSVNYSWSLVQQPTDNNFKIIGNKLILSKRFATKNEDFFTTITVRCTEKSNKALYAEKSFTLSFDNLNNPVTMKSLITAQVNENMKINTVIGNIIVIDKEEDSVNITDVSDSNTKSKFQLTQLACSKENGTIKCVSNIVLKTLLNYEETNEYTIIAEVNDEHNEKSRLSTKISVTDVNEPPTDIQFNRASLLVPEGSSKGFLVALITVSDEDQNVAECTILDNVTSPFEISSFSVLIKDGHLLDFEKKNSYTLAIKCTDTAGLWVKKQTQVLVTDVNEEPGNPCDGVTEIEFKSPVNTEIVTLNAVDSDNEVFAKQTLSFQLTSNIAPFVVIGNKIVVNGSLHPAHHYSVSIKVSDDGVLMKHTANGRLVAYSGTPTSKVFQCAIHTSDPCEDYHEYKNGLCQCKGKLTGLKCDRDPTRCQSNSCAPGSLCSQFLSSPVLCVERNFQLSMLLPISSNKFIYQNFRHNLEMYIASILEGNNNGKSLKTLGEKRKRRRRSTSETFYVEISEQMSIKGLYTLVRFLPYVTTNKPYILKDSNTLCPKFSGTDVRCLNAQDCEILKSVGIACGPDDGKQINTQGAKGEKKETSGTPIYTYIIPITASVILVIVILFLLYRRRNRSDKGSYSKEPVVYNNHRNNLEYPTPFPRKPLNTEASEGGQTMSDIEKNRILTDMNRFDSRVFDERNGANFECDDPASKLQRNIDPSRVNCRENRAYVDDSDCNNLKIEDLSNPLYASIGKSAKNPLYQSSMKDRNHYVDIKDRNHYTDIKDLKDAQFVDLVEEKAKEKEYAIIDDLPDPALRKIRRGPSLNVFDPLSDEAKEEKNFKKVNIGEGESES